MDGRGLKRIHGEGSLGWGRILPRLLNPLQGASGELVRWVEFQSLLEVFLCPMNVPHCQENEGQVAVGPGVFRIEPDSCFEFPASVGQAILSSEDHSEVVMGLIEGRVLRCCGTKVLDGLTQLSLCPLGEAEF